jgi:hypothetical protein
MNKSITMLAAGAMLSATLAGCGGSSGNAAADASMSATPSSGGGGMDAFLAEVSRILGTTSDTAEPGSTDQINATTPDDKEPAPVS